MCALGEQARSRVKRRLDMAKSFHYECSERGEIQDQTWTRMLPAISSLPHTMSESTFEPDNIIALAKLLNGGTKEAQREFEQQWQERVRTECAACASQLISARTPFRLSAAGRNGISIVLHSRSMYRNWNGKLTLSSMSTGRTNSRSRRPAARNP